MLEVIDRLSWPGSPRRANEDACGAAGEWAWVIDGSILPGIQPVLHETSDAAWFAGFASERFSVLAPGASDGPGLVRQVVEDAMAAFLAVAPPERRDPLTWPVAALTLVRVTAGRLLTWTIADTMAYVIDGSGGYRSVGGGADLRRAESARAAELLRRTGVGPEEIVRTAAFRGWLSELRREAGLFEIAALFGLHTAALERLEARELPFESPAVVLLATDGFSALVELYRAMDARQMVEQARAAGLAPLGRELRRIETEVDPQARRFPRFKTSDDATALLLRAE